MHKFWVLINYRFEKTLHNHSIIWHRIFSFICLCIIIIICGHVEVRGQLSGSVISFYHAFQIMSEGHKACRVSAFAHWTYNSQCVRMCVCMHVHRKAKKYPFLYFITSTKINFTLIYLFTWYIFIIHLHIHLYMCIICIIYIIKFFLFYSFCCLLINYYLVF